MRARSRSVAIVTVVLGALALGRSVIAVAAPGGAPVAAPSATAAAHTVVPTITVSAVGDICFASAPGRLIKSEGAKAPFSQVAAILKAATVTVGNLECVLSRRGSPMPGKGYTFEGDPAAVKGLTYAGFDLLAMANNHAVDFGRTALLDTISNLDKAGLGHAGAGSKWTRAVEPDIIVRNGARIALLSFCQIGPASFAATRSRSGTAYTFDMNTVTSAIESARKKADYVIVAFHWGIERRTTPTSTQVKFGRAAINAGADLVLSHHPHIIEGVEFYRGKLIAYSLGNFVFSPGTASGHDTLILTVKLTPRKIVAVDAYPCMIDGNGRPVPAKGGNLTRIIKAIRTTSKGRGTVVTVSKGRAHLRAR